VEPSSLFVRILVFIGLRGYILSEYLGCVIGSQITLVQNTSSQSTGIWFVCVCVFLCTSFGVQASIVHRKSGARYMELPLYRA